MSGASSTVSAAPPVPATASAHATAAVQAPETSPPGGPAQSFTEVLSAQRAETPRDGGDRHDADAKRDPSHGETAAASAKGGRPSSPSSSSSPSDPPPPASPVGVAPASGLAVSFAPAAEDPTEPSTPAPEGGSAVQEAAIAAGPVHSTHPPEAGMATASKDAGAPGAEVSAAAAQAVAVAEPGDPSADGPDSAVVSPSLTAEGTAVLGFAASRSTAASLPAHSGAAAEPGTAAAHTASTPAEAGGPPSSTPTPAPLPHLLPESPLAPSGAPRAAGAVLPVGGAAAPSAPTMAQQAASSLDVDDLSGSISRPLSDGNGTYTVTVALHPPELGHLQAVLSLDGNDLQVSLTAQTQTGHDALADATDALKNQLARGGVNVNVTLRDPGSQAGGDDRYRPPTSSGAGSFITESTAMETPLPSGLVSGQIHLVL